MCPIEVIEIGTLTVAATDHFLRRLLVDVVEAADALNAVGGVGGDEDIHAAWHVAQHVVGTAPDEDARMLGGRFADGIALEFEEVFFAHGVGVKLVARVADERDDRTEE